eukprot:768481-Hanusia_phi.AAC.3
MTGTRTARVEPPTSQQIESDDDQPSPFQSSNDLQQLIADLKLSNPACAAEESHQEKETVLHDWVERHKQSQQVDGDAGDEDVKR